MKKITTSLLLSLLFIFTNTYAQKEFNVWYLGYQAGLDFNTLQSVRSVEGTVIDNMPSPLAGLLTTLRETATISDSEGNYLFTTDGTNLYNKKKILVTSDLKGESGTHPVLVIPKPGSKSKYFIVSNSQPNSSVTRGSIYCTEYDVDGNGGDGAIVGSRKKLILGVLNFATDNIAVVLHENGRDYWLLNRTGQYLLAWLVTEEGIPEYPTTISEIPETKASLNATGTGTLAVSPDGTQLCGVLLNLDEVFFSDFSRSTGRIDNVILRQFGIKDFLVAVYSKEGNNIFLSGYIDKLHVMPAHNISTGNLTALDPTLSARRVGPNGYLYALKLSQSKSFSNIAVIPNSDAAVSDLKSYTFTNYQLPNTYLQTGLSYAFPNFPRANNVTSKDFACSGYPLAYEVEMLNTVKTENLSYFEWDFGDGTSKISDSDINNPIHSQSHIYADAGEYMITITPYNSDGDAYVSQKVSLTAKVIDCDLKVNPHIRNNSKFSYK